MKTIKVLKLCFVLILSAITACKHENTLKHEIIATYKVDDYKYVKDRYFFLDTAFREQYKRFTSDGRHISNPDRYVLQDSIFVFIGSPMNLNEPDKVMQGVATLDGSPIDWQNTQPVPGKIARSPFIQLDITEYHVDYLNGYIRLANRSMDYEIIAVSFITSTGEKYGDLNFKQKAGAGDVLFLKLLKDEASNPYHSVWDLGWKHVYEIADIEDFTEYDFDVKIFLKSPSRADLEIHESGKSWLTWFGLDLKNDKNQWLPDGALDNKETLSKPQFVELHFPDLRPFDPEGYYIGNNFMNQLPTEVRVPELYDETSDSRIRAASNFSIEFILTK